MGSCSSSDLSFKNEKNNSLNTNDIILVRDSWRKIVHTGLCEYGTEFMINLLLKNPNLKSMWSFPDDLDSESKMRDCDGLRNHGEKLFTAIEAIIYTLDDMYTCVQILIGIGRSHYNKGVREEHFKVFGEVFIETLHRGLGKHFDAKLKTSWIKFLILIETQMKLGFENI
ncbi:unnamed protein product [Brachionus calyciflorus]|uniref:Globin domain-containing protein n=1 Tax=Brachionus calyciflorus TaxID=104777 RepID=A0A814RN63_9BILA|nr:unnamed protein product [Brachionus calyciflorus]